MIEDEEILLAQGLHGPFVGAASDTVVHGTYRRDGQWAPELLELLCEHLLGSGGTLLDIGANIGLVAIPASKSPDMRTFAFEPDPRNAELLRRNVALHSLEKKIRIHQCGLFSEEGHLQLCRDPRNHGDQRLVREAVADRPHVEVPLARLDQLLTPEDLQAPVVAKIDTQGAEVDVLWGAGALLQHIDFAIVEVWPSGLARLGRTLEELVAILATRFDTARLLLEGEPIWPLAPLHEEFSRLDRVTTLMDEDTFFDILVGRQTARP